MKGVERTHIVMVHPTQRAQIAQYNLYAMEVDRERCYYSCGGFGHLTWNCKRWIMGQRRRVEYEDEKNYGQNNLNKERDLIVLN